jgi:superfamily II DNA or RNA helicase
MKFRNYQLRMILAQDAFMADPTVTRATILAATGAGKTVTFTDLIIKVLTAVNSGARRILVVHPRLALSANQQKRLKKDLTGLNVEFTAFSSGEVYNTLANQTNRSTTNRESLEEIIAEAGNRAHITFSSYKSLHKIADMDFDLIICDEAHYLVQNDLRDNLYKFKAKTIFYTGTPIQVAAQEVSMDNIELFGEVIEEVPFSELIPQNYIVAPSVRFLNAKTKRKGNAIDYPTTIAHAYKDQLTKINPKFNHKMLVAMPNTEYFEDIINNLDKIRKIVNDFNLDVYYVTADRVSKNGNPKFGPSAREEMLEDFEANPNRCIIIHCDTLAEGIDIDGIGGILLMRDLGMAKLIQTIGRACRAAKADILKNGEIRKNRIKTHAIITLVRMDNAYLGCSKLDKFVELFKIADYGDLWDRIDPEFLEQGKKREPGEPEGSTVFDEIQAIRVTERADVLWDQLFGQPA